MGRHLTANGMVMPSTAMSELETLALERHARDHLVLELGAELGYSTITMAKVARLVVSVDWHHGYNNLHQDTALQFLYNIKEQRAKIVPVIGSFQDVLPLLADASFDFIFLDGGHDVAGTLHCIEHARRLVRPGGMVATHDYGHPLCAEKQVLDGLGIIPIPPVIGTLALLGDLR